PLVQNCPNEQTLPHEPQLKKSADVLKQRFVPSTGQEVSGGRQVTPASLTGPVQVPLWQNCPDPQTLPHAPELKKSAFVLKQLVVPSNGQEVSGGRQVMPASLTMRTQEPLWQICPAPQTLPHAPQLKKSEFVLKQALPPPTGQEVRGGGQVPA